MKLNVHSCIRCDEDRAEGSAFCQPHDDEHEKSPWVKAWRKYQDEIRKVGDHKKVPWVAPY